MKPNKINQKPSKKSTKPKIFPSIMAQSQPEIDWLFKNLSGAAKELHLDVADGKCVPSTSLWFPFKLSSKFKYNIHLMIKNPTKWIEQNSPLKNIVLLIPQLEEIKEPKEYIRRAKSNRRKIAFALRPETGINKIKPYLPEIDYVLILTVQPGFYGAKFLSAPLNKIKQIKQISPKVKIIVDGGMNPQTVKKAAAAGADFFVSGAFTTKSNNPKKQIKRLMESISR